jgi:acetolactate synthase I/III small subunit
MNKNSIILELTVQNHPGVMSHITGLFARRAYNLEGILCGRIGEGKKSRILLLVLKDERLAQIIKQLRKLYDVEKVNQNEDVENSLFDKLDENI